jgi:rhomboid family GlyGly-CTERM serine protease
MASQRHRTISATPNQGSIGDAMRPITIHRRLKSAAGHLPGVSLALVVAACLLMAFPSLADRLQYDRSAVLEGELWRIATCHLTHWSLDHLFWDATALLFLGFVIEQEKRRRLLTCMGLSAVLIPLAVCVCMPDLSTYRGLSGIDSAVFMLLAVTLFSDSWEQRDWGWMLVCTAVMGGFAAKTGFEFVTGTTLFVDAMAAEMLPVPLAHVIGAGSGVLCGMQWKPRPQVKSLALG